MNIIGKILLGVMVVLPFMAQGQGEILNDKVEVTKSFSHNIGKATKRDIRPTKEDSVYIDIPTLDYKITYKPERYPFSITPLSTPSYKISEQGDITNLYVEAMGGVPLSSRAYVSYTTDATRNTVAGFTFDHSGFWGDLSDADNIKRDADETNNDLALFFGYKKSEFSAKILARQEYNSYSRYGFSLGGVEATPSSISQYFLRSTISVDIATIFDEEDAWNVNFHAQYNILIDKYGYDESIYQVGGHLSKQLVNLNSRLEANIEYASVIPSTDFILTVPYGEELPQESTPTGSSGQGVDNYKLTPTGLLSILPRYHFKYSGLDISVGALFSFNFNGNNANYMEGVTAIIPKALLSVAVANGTFTPYAALDGEYIVNSYHTLTEQNPYIIEGLSAPSTIIRRFYAGFKGDVDNFMSYNFNIGTRSVKNLIMYVNSEDGNLFTTMRCDTDNMEANFEVAFNHKDILSASFLMNYINYNKDEVSVYGYAPMTMNLNVNYTPIKDFYFTANAQYLSGRSFISDSGSVTAVDGVLDLSLQAEFMTTSHLGIKLGIDNLLNRKLYPFNNYEGIGRLFMGGVTYKF